MNLPIKENKMKKWSNKTMMMIAATFDVMTVSLILLKLTDVIDWRWVFVLTPFWLPFSVYLFKVLLK
jgi:hypothetical protein